MWPVVAQAVQAVDRHVMHFMQVVEWVAVEHFGAVVLVESVEIEVLEAPARLDMLRGDFFALSPLA